MMIPNTVTDRFAVSWMSERLCRVYLPNAAGVDALRTSDLEAAGVSAQLMVGLWQMHPFFAKRAAEYADCGRDYQQHPLMFVVDARTGEVLECWESMHPWATLTARLREVTHAA